MANKGRRAIYDERVRAVELIESGESPDVVAEVLGIGRSMVFSWWQDYRLLGVESLRTKHTPGRDATLPDPQMRRLRTLLTGANPLPLGFDFGLWTRRMVGELIRREFGVRLSESTVGRVLRRLGMSPQRPLHRAYQQNP